MSFVCVYFTLCLGSCSLAGSTATECSDGMTFWQSAAALEGFKGHKFSALGRQAGVQHPDGSSFVCLPFMIIEACKVFSL